MQLLLFLAHGNDNNQEEFEIAMSVVWKLDPVVSKETKNISISILNNQLLNLFRFALVHEPNKRTSADEWIQVLENSIQRIYLCPICNSPTIIDSSKNSCPQNHNFELLNLIDSKASNILSMKRKSFFIGRTQFNNDMRISNKQLFISRVGPELWVEHIGTNATKYKENGNWINMPKFEKIRLYKDNLLKILESID